jgi:hypothetical protein
MHERFFKSEIDKTTGREARRVLPMVQIMDDLRTASGSTSMDRLDNHWRLFVIESSFWIVIVLSRFCLVPF